MDTKEKISCFSIKRWQKWAIAIKVMPIVAIVAVLKYLSHILGFEVMELNALFTSLIGGTIFLIGFLISGVLSDYKESEKLPSDVAASLRTFYDDAYTISKAKNSQTALKFIEFQKSLITSLLDWFYKKERTRVMLKKISSMNEFFIDMDKEGVQPGYISKLKNEQNSLRKMLLRIDTIRDTSFIGSAYAIVETMRFLIIAGLLIIKIDPFYSSLFFTLLVTFLISYMFLLIRDIDDPFDFSVNGESGNEVSLKPIHDFESELKNDL